jgi:hypothetical protein
MYDAELAFPKTGLMQTFRVRSRLDIPNADEQVANAAILVDDP